MPKTKEISLELRKKIVEAHENGQGHTAISQHFTESRTAVHCIIAKYKETNSVRNKPGRGHKCKISRTLERKIVRDVSTNPWTSAKMIVADLTSSGVDVSRNAGLFIVVGFRALVPEEPLYSKSGTSQPYWSLNIWKVKMSFGSLCFGLMRLNWNCLGTQMLLMIGEERESSRRSSLGLPTRQWPEAYIEIGPTIPEGYQNQGPGVAHTEPRPQSYWES